jgi:hypothetical protein
MLQALQVGEIDVGGGTHMGWECRGSLHGRGVDSQVRDSMGVHKMP